MREPYDRRILGSVSKRCGSLTVLSVFTGLGGLDLGLEKAAFHTIACIELDDKGEVKIRYKDGKIEFLKGEKRVASLDMNGADDRAL